MAIPRSRQDIVETLIHGAHLINRRALGGNLPPWLSEGLADGIRGHGNGPADRNGAELRPPVSKWAMKPARCPAAASRRNSGEFDSGTVSYDYEQSAFLVRLLLTDPDLAPRFRSFLRALAAGSVYTPELFYEHLGLDASELDRRLEAWVRSEAPTRLGRHGGRPLRQPTGE